MSEIYRPGSRRIPATDANQTHGLILYDPKDPPLDEKGRPVFAIRLKDAEPACGAGKVRGGSCESTFRYPNGRCRKHGGPSLGGGASPSFRHGRDSKFRPKGDILENYQRYLADPQLAHHRDAIALVDSLAQEVLDHWEEGGTVALWKRLAETWERFEIAYQARNFPKAREEMAAISLLMKRGSDQSDRQAQVVRLLEASRRHRDSETKRKLSESMTFTIEEATAFYVGLGKVVRRYVLDPEMTNEEKLRAIENEMIAIAGERDVPTLLSGDQP